jgi:hypothetical protein
MTVGEQRWLRIAAALLGGRNDAASMSAGLCSACVEMLSVAGAGITLVTQAGDQVSMCVSNPTVRVLAELEFTLGNGPAMDAHERGEPVLETDLVNRPPTRWAAYCAPAVDAGVRAIFAFPLRFGAARLGALTLYQVYPGMIDDDTYEDALVAAEVITEGILTERAGLSPEALMAELADGAAFHAVVHQASGMVSVQVGIGVGDALARLRARAFALDRPIAEVAADVVARRLRFDE